MKQEQLKGLAERLKQRRRELGLTQEEMAERLEMTYSSYSKIENAFQQPGIDMLIRISSALSLSLDYLVFGSGARKAVDLSEKQKEELRSVSKLLDELTTD